MTDDVPALDVFYGELTVHRALVYARLPRPSEGDGWSLAGTIRGPRCLHAQTLPAAGKFVDQGSGPSLLAQAVLPDPVCWTADLPAIYDVTVNLLRGGEVVATARRELGLRRLGPRDRDLVLDGKRWVLRGVNMKSTTARLPREWHEGLSALVVREPSEDQLAEASQWGALAVVDFNVTADAATQLRPLVRYPAVAIAVIHGQLPADFAKAQHCPNLLLASHLVLAEPPTIPNWADLAVVQADDIDQFASTVRSLSVPIIAQRRLPAPLPLDEARAACDRLQRDLATAGQFAGYMV